MFLISLKAGGFGPEPHRGRLRLPARPWWNPAAERQAVDRTLGIGQDKHVMVYRLVAADTVEEKVIALQQRKADLSDAVLHENADGGGGFAATPTSTTSGHCWGDAALPSALSS